LVLLRRFSGSVGRCVVTLSLVTIAAYFVIGQVAYQHSGANGLTAAFAAALLCYSGAVLALLMTSINTPDPNAATSRLLLSILFRTAIPFGGAMMLSSSTVLSEAGVFGLTVAFYLITLATESVLSLTLLNRSAELRKAS